MLLPNGQVCAVGGVSVVEPQQGMNQVELYTPDIDWATNAYGTGGGTWSLEPGKSINTRNYYSTALLLPNSKVWVAGRNIDAHSGDPAAVGVRRIKLYEPPYVAVANQIQIAPRLVGYGEEFDVQIDRPATPLASLVESSEPSSGCLDPVGMDSHNVRYAPRRGTLPYSQGRCRGSCPPTPCSPYRPRPGCPLLRKVDPGGQARDLAHHPGAYP